MPETDVYGGYRKIRFDATGFFRLQRDDRWWFVSPEGHAFLSFGLNHVGPEFMFREYNADFWRKVFNLRAPWETSRGVMPPAFEGKVRRDLDALGMNTLGCHSPTSLYRKSFVPYVHPMMFVDICHYMDPRADAFPDVFSDAFALYCERLAREVAGPRSEDPYLLGYSLADCPILTELDAASRAVQVWGGPRGATPTWPKVLRNLGEGAEGKQEYVGLMRDRYDDAIAGFNASYETSFASFEELARAENWTPDRSPRGACRESGDEASDNLAFLSRIIDRYYRVTTDAIRRHDPNHLIFGDKFNAHYDIPDDILRIAARHMDILFYQYMGHYPEQKPILDRWSALTGKPLFNGDSTYSVPHPHMPCPLGPHCRTEEERAAAFEDFAARAFARNDFIGWNWCGWMENWEAAQSGRQHCGLLNPFGDFYEPIRDAMKRFSENMYGIAAGCLAGKRQLGSAGNAERVVEGEEGHEAGIH